MCDEVSSELCVTGEYYSDRTVSGRRAALVSSDLCVSGEYNSDEIAGGAVGLRVEAGEGGAGGPLGAEGEVGRLDGTAARALGEVVEGGDGDDPAGARIGVSGDVHGLRAEGGLGGRR